MTGAADPTVERKLSRLIREILLWNSQINLVSRVDPDARVGMLVSRCRAGWDLLQDHLGGWEGFSCGPLVDIGSGAGLPGLVWAVLREARGCEATTYLVEPRQKRAWFLRRTARTLSLDRVLVLAHRWGEGPPARDREAGRALIVSMKALRLDDRRVLEGLADPVGGSAPATLPGEVAIVRFLSTGDAGGPPEAGPAAGGPATAAGGRYELRASEVLGGPEGPRLGLRRYVLQGRDGGG